MAPAERDAHIGEMRAYIDVQLAERDGVDAAVAARLRPGRRVCRVIVRREPIRVRLEPAPAS